MPAANASSPWYKHIWPWIIIAILACSVTLTLSMVTIAVNNPDNLVNDNYYEAGKGINRALDRELLGQTLQLKAKLRLDEMTGEVVLLLEGNSKPQVLELNLISPTQPEKDRKVSLSQSATEPGRYIGQLDDKIEGRRFVELLGVEDGKTWRLFEEELVGHDKDLLLGDEPIQGAEDHNIAIEHHDHSRSLLSLRPARPARQPVYRRCSGRSSRVLLPRLPGSGRGYRRWRSRKLLPAPQ